MPRSALADLPPGRHWFVAEIGDFGWRAKEGRRKVVPTVLLVDLALAETPGQLLTDHVWCDAGGPIGGFALGDVVRFRAKVREYPRFEECGLLAIDYSLTTPNRPEVLATAEDTGRHSCTEKAD